VIAPEEHPIDREADTREGYNTRASLVREQAWTSNSKLGSPPFMRSMGVSLTDDSRVQTS
jgi:hypothetical protein